MKSINISLVFLISIFSSPYTLANNNIVFQCVTTNNKHLLVTKNKDAISYKFGKNLSNPEIALTTKNVIYMPWDGAGSYVINRLEVQNGNISYTVFSSYLRDPDNLVTESGVIVSKNDRELATIYCNESLKYISNLDDEKLLFRFRK